MKKAAKWIESLFKLAENSKLANKYVAHAKNISKRTNTTIPRELKRKFCKHCGSHFTGNNLRVRRNTKGMIYTCLECQKQTRYPIK